MPTIIVVGGSYAGIIISHRLLKNTLPAVQDLKVVLVSPSTHHYHNMASVRAIVPGQFADETIFADIAPGFSHYPTGSFEFVEASAEAIDVEGKKLTLTNGTVLSYDHLVITTGAKTAGDAPWKASGSYEKMKDNLHAMQKKVEAAKSIIIGGAGATGVETAGELGFEYGKTKEITLIAGDSEILEGTLGKKWATPAGKELEKLNVKILRNTKITGFFALRNGTTDVEISTGEKLTADLFLNTLGVFPNTSFIPKNLLNERTEAIVDDYLHVESTTDIWAAGDVTDAQGKQFVNAQIQAIHLSKNLDLVLKGKEPVVFNRKAPDMLGITLGRSKATGHFGSFTIPSKVIWFVKGRKLWTDKVAGLINGNDG